MDPQEKLLLLEAERKSVLQELLKVSPNNKYLFFDLTGLSQSEIDMRNDAMQVMYLPNILLGQRLTIAQKIIILEKLLINLHSALSLARMMQQVQ